LSSPETGACTARASPETASHQISPPVPGEKTPERDLHAPVEEKTSLARDDHAPVTDDPDGWNKQQRNKTTPVNPSERRVSLESPWLSVDLASKVETD
jgi:hypothetical protein